MSGWYATTEERRGALQAGAGVLAQAYPLRTQMRLQIRVGPNFLRAMAVFHWPGIVRVTLQSGGELMAESRPGQPYELNESIAYVTRD